MANPSRPPNLADGGTEHSQALLESLGAGVFGVDRQGNFTFLNPAAVKLFGFDSQHSVIGANSHRLTHHTDSNGNELPARDCRIYQVMADGQPLSGWRDLFWRSDGSSFPVEVYANPILDDTGAVNGAVVGFHDITEQVARERTLIQYRRAFEASRDAIMLTGPSGFLLCNPATNQLFQASDENSLIGRHPGELAPPTQPDGTPSEKAATERMAKAFAEGSAFFEWTHQTLKGRIFPAEVLLSRVDLPDGSILQALVRDISEKQAAFEELERARQQAQQYFEASRIMNLVLDPDGRIGEINTRGCELLGLPREQLVGRDWFAEFLPEEERDRLWEVFNGFLEGTIHPGGTLENVVTAAHGDRLLLSFRNSVLYDDAGRVRGLLASGEDITEQRRWEVELEYRATKDELTGLFNRRKFEEVLNQELERAERYATVFALVMFDVDHFKAINDTYGHELGDRILGRLARVVAGRTRAADVLCRWGGEEFMILLPETDRAGAEQLAEAIRSEVAATDFPGPGQLTISLGVVAHRPGERRRDLAKRADDALYRAKGEGRNRVVAG